MDASPYLSPRALNGPAWRRGFICGAEAGEGSVRALTPSLSHLLSSSRGEKETGRGLTAGEKRPPLPTPLLSPLRPSPPELPGCIVVVSFLCLSLVSPCVSLSLSKPTWRALPHTQNSFSCSRPLTRTQTSAVPSKYGPRSSPYNRPARLQSNEALKDSGAAMRSFDKEDHPNQNERTASPRVRSREVT
jgi:hypothetical protein